MICVPVKTKENILGVLQAINKNEGSFDDEDREGLSALANQVAIAIENANLYENSRRPSTKHHRPLPKRSKSATPIPEDIRSG